MEINKYDKYLIDSFSEIDTYINSSKQYDLFISAFNMNSNVHDLYKATNATYKLWLVLPEYGNCIPDEGIYFEYKECICNFDEIESSYINNFLESHLEIFSNASNICIDITGFVKPYLIYLILSLNELYKINIDIIYTEPKIYNQQEDTKFSCEETVIVRPVLWNDLRVDNGTNDLLIMNPGYDHKLVTNVVNKLPLVKYKKILLGFPSLQPMMFQENILNFELASENLGLDYSFKPLLASANDPFETAKVLNNFINDYIERYSDINTIYLAPLATKAQTLGFVVFYMEEFERLRELCIELKIIYPFTKSYYSNTNKELFKINKYSLS